MDSNGHSTKRSSLKTYLFSFQSYKFKWFLFQNWEERKSKKRDAISHSYKIFKEFKLFLSGNY